MSTTTDTARQRMVIVLRLAGEVSTKSSSVRRRFHNRLLRNIRDALSREDIAAELQDHWFRIDVKTDDPRAVDVMRRMFGVQKIHLSHEYAWRGLDDLVERGEALFADSVRGGRRFAVDARRAGHREDFPFTSVDVARALGAKLVEAGGRVDLSTPEFTAGVEVRADAAYFFDRELPGPAGLPIGVEGRALALMSGGFDSAVAAWQMLKRGVDLDFVFFDLGGPPHQRAVREVTHTFASRWLYGYDARLHIIDFRPVIAEMKDRVPGRFWQLLLKRMMMRAADTLAQKLGHLALVTGEAVGQVSSQTLPNLAALSLGLSTPILRPLVAFNKDEIIELSRHIGTYDVCRGVPEFCALDGGRPITNATPEKLEREEQKLDLGFLDMLIEHRRMLRMHELPLDESAESPELATVPDGVTVLDLRPRSAFASWHYPGAIQLDFDTAMASFGLLPKDRRYLLVCDVGLKSAFLAEAVREMGFEAYSFRGGLRALRKHTERVSAG